MKQPKWATIKAATEQLAESVDGYAFELSNKKSKESNTQVVEASDDIAFTVWNVAVLYPDMLNPLIEALGEKECYSYVTLLQLTGERDTITLNTWKKVCP